MPTALALLLVAFVPALRTGAQIELRLVDEERQPVAGATATTFEDSTAGRATTDASGRCLLAAAPAPRPIRVRVEKEGWFHSDVQVLARPALELTLRRAVKLTGRVVAQGHGAPVPEAAIELVHPGCRDCEPERARSDPNGGFELLAPRAVELELRISAPGFARQKVVLAAITEREAAARSIEIEPGHAFLGRVVDLETGETLAGATVVTVPDRLIELESSGEGLFELHAVAERASQLLRFQVQAPGYCRLEVVLPASEIAPGKALRCPLVRPAAIAGVVLDPQDRPVAGAEVFLREDASWLAHRRERGSPPPRIPLDDLPPLWGVASGRPSHATRTDADGRFRFDQVVPWTSSILVQSQHPTGGGAQLVAGPIGAPGTTFETVLQPPKPPAGGRLAGTLKLNGEPIGGSLEWRGPTRSGRLFVDPRGNFAGPGIEPGEVVLAITAAQTRTVRLGKLFAERTAVVQVELGRETRHDFAFEQPLAELRGRVRSASGRVPDNVALAASEPVAQIQAQTELATDGTFSFQLPDVGRPWTLLAVSGPQQFERNDARPGGEAVEFVVPDLGLVRLRVVDATTGAPLPQATVMWRKKGAGGMELRNLLVGPDPGDAQWGRAAIPYGEWELGAWVALGTYPPSAPVAVTVAPEGPPPVVDFRLKEGQPVTFRLAADSATPPAGDGGRLWILEDEWWALDDPAQPEDQSLHNVDIPSVAARFRELRFGAERESVVGGLRPGRYRFVTSVAGDSIEPAVVTVGEGRNAPIEIRWKGKAN